MQRKPITNRHSHRRRQSLLSLFLWYWVIVWCCPAPGWAQEGGRQHVRGFTESRVLDLNLTHQSITTLQQRYPELRGQGIVVSVQEEAFDPDDPDLIGRSFSVGLAADRLTAHATAMATVIAGAGNTSILGRGVAPAAWLTSSSLVDFRPDPDSIYRNHQIFIQNHSYGSQIEGRYSAEAAAYDASVYRVPQLLHVFSAGNAGRESGQTRAGEVEALANLTGSYKQAKNVLVVGAVDSIGRSLAFSSRGPAFDGRIKPDVAAYSQFGTSNAAALVSGIAALLQQAYLQQTGYYPTSALLRAGLVNSAHDVETPGPDYQTGYGAVDALHAVEMIKNNQFREDSILPGETKHHQLVLPQDAARLSVTLAWSDHPAAAGSMVPLVHDLDLRLVSPAGDTIYPWTMAGLSDLAEPAYRGGDTINTLERVTVAAPADGTWQLLVDAGENLADRQDFALIWHWQIADTLQWRFPLEEDILPTDGERFAHLRWHATLPDTTGDLYWRTDSRSGFVPLQRGIRLRNGSWRWEVPKDQLNWVQFMLRVGDWEYPTAFVPVRRPPRIEIELNCGDSLLLGWLEMAGAQGYEVRALQAEYLETIATTKAPRILLKKSQLASDLLTVRGVLTPAHHSLHAEAIILVDLPEVCYIESFFADDLSDNLGIVLEAGLSTLWDVAEVRFLRQTPEGGFTLIHRLSPKTDSITWLDEGAAQGINKYLLEVETRSGRIFHSEQAVGYRLQTPTVLYFPNPVRAGSMLNVFTGRWPAGATPEWRLYDTSGRVVRQERLLGERSAFALGKLPAGVYVSEVQGLAQTVRRRIIVF